MNNQNNISLIYGLGISGSALKRLFEWQKKTFITFDEKDGIPLASSENLENIDTAYISPGVPLTQSLLNFFHDRKIKISSELEYAFSFLTTEKVIGVTGSLGKNTVSSLLAAAADRAGLSFFLGGNIGIPLADYVFQVQTGLRTKADWVILELSSYQLENFASLKCEASAITYLTPNHMDRYKNLEHYYATKIQLFEKTKPGFLFGNARGGDLKKYLADTNWIHKVVLTDQTELLAAAQGRTPSLLGEHNKDNIALALKLVRSLHWPESAIEGLLKYPGLPHRLEVLPPWSGRTVINDSKATSMASVTTAIKACVDRMPSNSNLFVLLGGRDKGLPWHQIVPAFKEKNLIPVFFGEIGPSVQKEFLTQGNQSGLCFPKLGGALEEVKKRSSPGDWILLSPGGSSLDEFKNFEERGRFFAQNFSELTKK